MKKLSLIKLSETELDDIQAAGSNENSVVTKFYEVGCKILTMGSMRAAGLRTPHEETS